MISAIILAAGESERMDKCKQLLKICGKNMVEKVVETVKDSQVDETIVVLGHKADQVLEKLPEENLKIVFNPDYQKGMSTSLKAGIRKLGEETEAVLIVLADQPLVEPEVINRMIKEYEENDGLILAPVYEGERGNPVILDISLKDEMMNVEGDVGARNILKNRGEDFRKIEVGTPSVVMDVDTREDVEKIEKVREDIHGK